MRRPKRNSPAIKKAGPRAAALCAIDPALDLGEGLTLAGFKDRIKQTQAKLDDYNTLLSKTDSALTALELSETELFDLCDRMLKGVASRYGQNSDEYVKAGGTRKDAIRRSPRKSKIDKLAA